MVIEGERKRVNAGADADALLVQRCLQGEQEAFGQILDRYRKSVYNYVYRMTFDREEARDLAQEVFIRVFTSLSRYDRRYAFSTWLYRIATNLCIDWLRRRRPHVSLDTPLEIGDRTVSGDIQDSAPTPREVLARKEESQAVKKAVASLPAKYRIPLILRHYEGLSCREIAGILKVPEATARVRLFRARDLLRSKITGIME
jgi:RNA polymerase sigma-70 factor (ECF subfamily)